MKAQQQGFKSLEVTERYCKAWASGVPAMIGQPESSEAEIPYGKSPIGGFLTSASERCLDKLSPRIIEAAQPRSNIEAYVAEIHVTRITAGLALLL